MGTHNDGFTHLLILREKSLTHAFLTWRNGKTKKIKVVIEDGGGQANRRETCRQVHRTAICLANCHSMSQYWQSAIRRGCCQKRKGRRTVAIVARSWQNRV